MSSAIAPASEVERPTGVVLHAMSRWLRFSLVVAWSLLAMFLYAKPLASIGRQWLTHPSYSHGWLVLPLMGWLLWHRRSCRPSSAASPWAWGLVMLITAQVGLWLGNTYHLPALAQWSIPIWLVGFIGVVYGQAVVRWTLPVVGLLVFAIPFPFRVELILNHGMQSASAIVSCYLLALTSTHAETDGSTLSLDSTQLGITIDCSGMRMTIALAAAAYVMCLLSRASLGKRLQLFLCLLPAAVLANALRIAALAWCMQNYRQDVIADWVHDVGDWLALPIAAGLLALARTAASFPQGSRLHPRLLLCAILAVAVVASVMLHARLRNSAQERLATEIATLESEQRWDQVLVCARQLMSLQPQSLELRLRHANAVLHLGNDTPQRIEALHAYQAILEKTPYEIAALQAHLAIALDLNLSGPALASASRLCAVDRESLLSRQLYAEAVMRFSSGTAEPPLPLELACSLAEQSFQQSPGLEPFHADASASSLPLRPSPVGAAGAPHALLQSSYRHGRFLLALAGYLRLYSTAADDTSVHQVSQWLARAIELHPPAALFHLERYRLHEAFQLPQHALPIALLGDNQHEVPADVRSEFHLLVAERCVKDQQHKEAVSHLQAAIRLSPDNDRAYFILAESLSTREGPRAAVPLYARAWLLSPRKSHKCGLPLAEALLATGQVTSAERIAEELAESGPSTELARFTLLRAQLAEQRGKYNSALDHIAAYEARTGETLESAGAPSDKETELFHAKARCLVRLQRYADAAQFYESWGVKDPRNDEVFLAAARAWRSAGRPLEASRCYRCAFQSLGVLAPAWIEHVQHLVRSSGPDSALAEIKYRQKSSSNSAAEQLALASAWELLGHPHEALRLYRLAADQDAASRAPLCILLARMDRTDEAMLLATDTQWVAPLGLRAHTVAMVGVMSTELNQQQMRSINDLVDGGLKQAHDDQRLLGAAAEWYAKRQQFDTAIDVLQQWLDLAPDNPVAANNLAILLAEQRGDYDRALRTIDRVLERSGKVAEFMDTKGWILLQMDRPVESVVYFRAAVDSQGERAAPLTHLHTARAYLALGDYERARHHFRVASTHSQLRIETLSEREVHAWLELKRELEPGNHMG